MFFFPDFQLCSCVCLQILLSLSVLLSFNSLWSTSGALPYHWWISLSVYSACHLQTASLQAWDFLPSLNLLTYPWLLSSLCQDVENMYLFFIILIWLSLDFKILVCMCYPYQRWVLHVFACVCGFKLLI